MPYLPCQCENPRPSLLSPTNPMSELLQSLHLIIASIPPSDPWAHSSSCPLQGLFTGPTSLAYLFLRLSTTHPSLTIDCRTPKEWCLAYLACGQASVTPDDCDPIKVRTGVTSEKLAYAAVLAAATGDADAAATLEAGRWDPWVDQTIYDYLYGQAGFLALLRLVRTFRPEFKDAMDRSATGIIEKILAAPSPWKCYGHEYLGAAHGNMGIVAQVVLSEPGYAEHPRIKAELERILELQMENGNWPVALQRRKDLVQWCHGAPGTVMSLVAIRSYFPEGVQARIDVAVERGRNCVWELGLLTKEPNLCHGIIGNALALEGEHRSHFMALATKERIEQGLEEGRFVQGSDSYGLMWGEAGRAWAWMVFDKGIELGYPAYTDVWTGTG